MRVSDDESSPSVRWRHILENDGLNGGRPPHDVIPQNRIGLDATSDVRKPFVLLESFRDDDSSMVDQSESIISPKTGHPLANLTSLQIVDPGVAVIP